jgi:Rhodopirellula transposase DDE domain
VAHYPAYASKDNPIEQRLFPHLTRAWQGVILHTIDLVKELMEKAKTKTGLQVTVDILAKVYRTGRKVADSFKQNMPILFDPVLPNWNSRAVPSSA